MGTAREVDQPPGNGPKQPDGKVNNHRAFPTLLDIHWQDVGSWGPLWTCWPVLHAGPRHLDLDRLPPLDLVKPAVMTGWVCRYHCAGNAIWLVF